MDKMAKSELNTLILQVKKRNDNAFATLLSRYTPMLNKVISGFSSPRVSYSEAFSEASATLFRSAISYDIENGAVTFGLYAKICVYRKLCDLYEKAGREDNTVDFDIDKIAVSSNLEARLVGMERMQEYLNLAKKILSPYEYEVFLLYIEGESTEVIADKLSRDTKSVENAKNRMFRALREEAQLFSDI